MRPPPPKTGIGEEDTLSRFLFSREQGERNGIGGSPIMPLEVVGYQEEARNQHCEVYELNM